MDSLLRLAGWYVDTVLKSWFPLEKEPSLEDLERVSNAEIGEAINQLIAAFKELRAEIRSSVVSEAAAETPGEEPSTSPGGITFAKDELRIASIAIYAMHTRESYKTGNRSPYHLELAKKFEQASIEKN